MFLDIPGFPLEVDEDINLINNLPERVVLSDRIRAWHLGERQEDDEPVRDVESLEDYRITQARLQFAGLIRNFFSNINVGDIVVVPAPDEESEVLFGEVLTTKPVRVATELYGDDDIPGLEVEWIAKIVRARIPPWLERKIPSPMPVRLIERERYNLLFDMLYERYFYRSQFVCKFKVSSEKFNSLDNFLFQQIILYVAALYEFNRDNKSNIDVTRSIAMVASTVDMNEDIPDLRISIDSPGHIVIFNRNLIPLVAGVLMALSASVGAAEMTETLQIKVVNTSDNSAVSKECQADIGAEVVDDLKAMGYQRWQEMCEIEARARSRTNINPGMGVNPASPLPQNPPLRER